MTHSLYLSIIGAVVFLAAYIILRLLRDNERLILELDEAKAEARTLDADLDEARRANVKANDLNKVQSKDIKALRTRIADLAEYEKKFNRLQNFHNVYQHTSKKERDELREEVSVYSRKVFAYEEDAKKVDLEAMDLKKYKVRFEAVRQENEKIRQELESKISDLADWMDIASKQSMMRKRQAQRLYGRIGAMQRKINRLKSLP